jgi:hypothetical protein
MIIFEFAKVCFLKFYLCYYVEEEDLIGEMESAVLQAEASAMVGLCTSNQVDP